MREALVVFRLLAGRKVQNLAMVVVMALSVAVGISVLLVANGLHFGLTRAVEPFPMLMGAKGSPNQLVLNSVFLKDQPIGNFSYDKVEELRRDKNVAQAVPLGFGDNYKGFRLVGTEQEIFGFRGVGASKSWLKLAEGRLFDDEEEAVIGADVAARCKLKLGDSFSSVHGVTATVNSKEHQGKYKVTGILEKVDGPYDGAIFVSLKSVWKRHEHGHKEAAGTGRDESEFRHGHEEAGRDVTAVLIRPTGYAAAMQLAASYSKDRDVQLVFPAKTVIELFAVLGDAEKLLEALSLAVLFLALVIIVSSLYWFIFSSLRQQAVLRALGASSSAVSRLYFYMGTALVSLGLFTGLILGHGLYALIAGFMAKKAGLFMPQMLLVEEAALALLVLLCGMLFSYFPARYGGRRDIASGL